MPGKVEPVPVSEPAPPPVSAAVTPQVVTTTASVATSTAAAVAPVSATTSLFKSSACTKHFAQQAAHDKGLPKAMVKPNILTHVIEGYVIQEAGEPFAVNRPLREWADKEDKENKLPSADEPPRKKQMMDSGANVARITSSNESNESATTQAANVKSEPTSAAADSECAPADAAPNATKWTVSEVCDFIRNIPGCASYADDFLLQEVDGEALLLIKPEHLVMALSMKLGPALKIVACIDALRPEGDHAAPHD
ncbi:hypothetical protein JYU34_000253 [Plutella xylostella]|uniref:SAM domain-containing protein n=1 Tax=Plutella xylostella TaxID=51655 RepID=A0ABQ7R789_PLUXY|nr:hypothetical protein JYU34_000253 [Plutella xylostella]